MSLSFKQPPAPISHSPARRRFERVAIEALQRGQAFENPTDLAEDAGDSPGPAAPPIDQALAAVAQMERR